MTIDNHYFFEEAAAMEYFDEDPYPELREILAPEFAALPPEDIEDYLESLGVNAEELEGIISGVRSVARRLVPAISGAIQGGSRGGITGAVTGALQGALGGGRSAPPATSRQVQQVTPARAAGGQSPATPTTTQPATAYLLQLLQSILSPEVIQALMSMLLNQLNSDDRETLARTHVFIGETLVPDTAIPTALVEAAERFAAEFNLAMPQQDEGIPRYLLDAEGEYRVNPANPAERIDPVNREHRAAIVLNLLDQAAAEEDVLEDDQDEFWLEDEYSDRLDAIEEALQDAWDNVDAYFAEEEI